MLLFLLTLLACAHVPLSPPLASGDDVCIVDRIEGSYLVIETPSDGWLDVPSASFPNAYEGYTLPCPE